MKMLKERDSGRCPPLWGLSLSVGVNITHLPGLLGEALSRVVPAPVGWGLGGPSDPLCGDRQGPRTRCIASGDDVLGFIEQLRFARRWDKPFGALAFPQPHSNPGGKQAQRGVGSPKATQHHKAYGSTTGWGWGRAAVSQPGLWS